MSRMRIIVTGVRPEVLESTREAGKVVATRVRYDVLLNATPRSQWRACFTSPSSYSTDRLPSRYTFGEKSVSYECPQSEAARQFEQLEDYIRQANARSQELEGLSRRPAPRADAGGRAPRQRPGQRGPGGDGTSRGTVQDLETLKREIEAEVRGWPTGCEERG
jgi:hypothetical protein